MKLTLRKVIINGLILFLYIWPWFALPWKSAILFLATMLILQFALGDIWRATRKGANEKP